MVNLDHILKLNGMRLILDLEGVPDKLATEMKRVTNSPWLTMKQKVHIIDNMRKNYLTQLEAKRIVSDQNHY